MVQHNNERIVKIVTGIRRGGRRSFRDQERISLHNWCTD